jgi:hypothetical protein
MERSLRAITKWRKKVKTNILYSSFVRGEKYLIAFFCIYIKKHWKDTRETNKSREKDNQKQRNTFTGFLLYLSSF